MTNYNLVDVKNFNKICRVCLGESEQLEKIHEVNLLDEQNKKLDLVEIFKKYCYIEISPNDNKPQNMCKPCIVLLYQSYSFFEKFTWSNSILENILENKSEKDLLLKNEDDIKDDVYIEEKEKDIGSKITENESLIKESPKTTTKTEEKYFSDSEVDEPAFFSVENDNDLSDCESQKKEVESYENIDIDDLPLIVWKKKRKELEKKEQLLEENLENHRTRRGRRKVQEVKQTIKKRGRPRKKELKVENDQENVDTQSELRCRLCLKTFLDINTAIDHYDEIHAPKLERDECILCDIDKPKQYKRRENLLYHMGLHSKDSVKCIPCRRYFRNKELLDEHIKDCFKVAEIKSEVKSEESSEENCPASEEVKKPLNKKIPDKLLKGTQDGSSDYICQLCNKNLGEINAVIEHYEKSHLDDLQCIICLRTFTKRVPLFHLGLHSSKSFVCRPCRLYFRTEEEYSTHLKKYDHDKSLSCKICGKTFTRNYKKNKHMLSHLKEKNYSCNKCDKKFTYKTSLVRHYKMHFGKRFLCSSCGNAYTTKFMLQRHWNIMHKNVDSEGNPLPKPPPMPVNLQCEFCGEIFTTKYGYGRHIRRHPEFNAYKCKICSFMCDNKEQLEEHMEGKHNKHTCEVCGKRFPFESELKTHFRKHEAIEMARFRCEVCGKAARTLTQLRVHIRIHTGERPFSCEICNKSFKQTAHLKVHMYQHTGKMPFKCEVCEKCFPFQHVMEIHMRTHTGEKPFQCMFCGNAYHDRTTMQKHQKKKHPEMPLQKVPRGEYKMTKLVNPV